MDKAAQMNPSAWVSAEFAKYGPAYALAMTRHLFGDQVFASIAGLPEAWANSGLQVKSLQRSLIFDGANSGVGIIAGASQILPMNFSNGQNFILFSRAAVATDSSKTQLNQAVIDYDEKEQGSGLIICDPAPLFNLAGSGEWPKIFPTPDMVNGRITRNVTLKNNGSTTIDRCVVTWDVCMLYTGR